MELASTGVSAAGKVEPRRMAGIAFFVLTFALAMFFSKIAAASLAALHVNDTTLFGISALSISSIIGFGLAIAIGVACWMNPKVNTAGVDIATELKRVTWPTFAETRVSTIAVIVASLVAAGTLFVFDFFASKIMTQWVPALLGWIARL